MVLLLFDAAVGAGPDPLPAPQVGHGSYYDVSFCGVAGASQGGWLAYFAGPYAEVGFGIARVERWSAFNRLRYGLQGSLSIWRHDWHVLGYCVRPFVGGEFRWAGLEAGALFLYDDEWGTPDISPSVRLRLGPSDVIYVEAAICAPELGPEPWIELSIGTSRWNWGGFRAGICSMGFFLTSSIRTDYGLSFSPLVSYAASDLWQVSLGLHYNFKHFAFRPVRLGEY